MRRINQIACALLISCSASAGGLLTNTNQNVAFLRNIARNATMDIDAVYSNPAGIAFLPDGFHFSLNGQSAFQTRTVTSTFQPFAGNADGSANADGRKKFKGEASAPLAPSLQAAWKKDKWSIAFNFAITGGGGKATFNEGLASFESQVAIIPILLTAQGIPTTQYSLDSYMRGRQYVYGVQLGTTYKVTDNFSAYLGGRMNYVSNSYYGYLHNISANLFQGELVNLNQTFTTYATQYREASIQASLLADQYEAAGNLEQAAALRAQSEQLAAQSSTASQTAKLTADRELDCDQSGWGLTPILGLDWKVGNLNLGVKYEFRTNLNIENKTTVNTTGVPDYDHGVNTPNDLPAILTLGAQYSIIPSVRVMAGYNHFFDKSAGMSNNRHKSLSHGTNEYLAGAEWDITDRILVSGGYQSTNYGVTDAFLNDMSFSLSSFSIGFGGRVKFTDRLSVNIAYFVTTYDKFTDRDNYASLAPYGFSGVDVFKRTNKVFGLGVDYTF